MKLANLSLTKCVKNSKVDFVSKMKYYLGLVVALVISAIFIVSFLGFRADFDYTGGSVLTVVSSEISSSEDINKEPYNNVVNKIDKIVKAHGISVSSYQLEETAFGYAVVCKILNKDEAKNNAIKNELYTQFEYDGNNPIEKNYVNVNVMDQTAGQTTEMAAVALSVAIVVLFVLALFRYNISSALVYFISVLLDILILFTLLIVCRFEINISICASFIVVFLISSITKLIFLKQANAIRKEENYKDLTKRQAANLALKNIFAMLTLSTIVCVIALVLLAGLGTFKIRNFALPTMVGIIFSSLTTFFVTSWLWEKIKIKDIKFKKQTKQEE